MRFRNKITGCPNIEHTQVDQLSANPIVDPVNYIGDRIKTSVDIVKGHQAKYCTSRVSNGCDNAEEALQDVFQSLQNGFNNIDRAFGLGTDLTVTQELAKTYVSTIIAHNNSRIKIALKAILPIYPDNVH